MLALRRFALGVLGYNILVILGGAYVRASGSGAGCGRSWPTCQGEILPTLEGSTTVEFGHRVMSGIAAILVVALALWVRAKVPPFKPARRAALWAVIAITAEALIGAILVTGQWVAEDTSAVRSLVVPLHLANTFLLLAALTTLVFWLTNEDWIRGGLPSGILWIGFGLVLVALTGGGTALADTLFGNEASSHFLTQMRILHPIFAMGVGALVVMFVMDKRWSSREAKLIVILVIVQALLGVLNVVFVESIPMGLIHLLVADLLWIAWVWLGAGMSSAKGMPASKPPWDIPEGKVFRPRPRTPRAF